MSAAILRRGSLLFFLGCSTPPPPPTSTDAATDVVALDVPVDLGAPTDDVPTDDGRMHGTTFGVCGLAIAQQACACAENDQPCQSRAFSSDIDCTHCLQDDQRTCCPDESMALQSCLGDANVTCHNDGACLQRACMDDITALTACQGNLLATQRRDGAGDCYDGYVACLGDLARGNVGCP